MGTNGVTWTSEDVKLVEKFIEIRNKGFYASGEELTSAYNRILNKRVNPTNCGSCIRARINELEEALNRFKKQLEKETPVAEEPKENKKPKTKK